ncbi:hypothetical protein Trydic_g8107 [Trypoxylus dichotomus]
MWSDESTKGLFKKISEGPRIKGIVEAGDDVGFISNALLIARFRVKTSDYHSDMNAENYSRWIEQKLISNLPTNYVVVIDNASYHNTQTDHAARSNSKRSEIIEWLALKIFLLIPEC